MPLGRLSRHLAVAASSAAGWGWGANRLGSEVRSCALPPGVPPLPLPDAGPAGILGPQPSVEKAGQEELLLVRWKRRLSGKWRETPATTPRLCRARWRGCGGPLFGVAVGPIVRLLGSGEAKAAHSGIREAPAARPRRRDGEAHAAVRQPAAVALVQPGELPGGIEVPDLGHHGPAPPAGRVGFRQRQPPGHEEHVTWEPKQVTD